jgi:hypothetical protein
VLVGADDDGHTVELVPGQQLRIVLASTYWQFENGLDQGVLRAVGRPQTDSTPTSCVPGGGCGAVTATFVAVAVGRAEITAHRSSCGEAMACTGDTGSFRLQVIVTN